MLALGKQARVLRAVSRFSSTPDELYLELDEEAATFAAIDSPEEVKADDELSTRCRSCNSSRGAMRDY
jgi:hypothetical protein